MRPSAKEVEEVQAEESNAYLNYAEIAKKSETVELEKKAARHRLMLARAAKRAIIHDLLSL